MTSPKETDGSFSAAGVQAELNPDKNKKVKIDPVSSEISTSLEIKKQAEAEAKAAQKKKERGKKDAMQTLKTTIIVSAVIVAVAGAAFAITKKLREK